MLAGNQKDYRWRGGLLFWMCGWYWSSIHCTSIMFWCNFLSCLFFSFLFFSYIHSSHIPFPSIHLHFPLARAGE